MSGSVASSVIQPWREGETPAGTPDTRVRLAEVSATPLSVDRALDAVSDASAGGQALFVGVVRDRDGDHPHRVVRLDYSHHPTAAAVLRDCAVRVCARHDVVAVAVAHRVGRLEVGDVAVIVAVSAAHRRPALAACAELIDEVKASVPIWKKQHFTSGSSEWVGL